MFLEGSRKICNDSSWEDCEEKSLRQILKEDSTISSSLLDAQKVLNLVSLLRAGTDDDSCAYLSQWSDWWSLVNHRSSLSWLYWWKQSVAEKWVSYIVLWHVLCEDKATKTMHSIEVKQSLVISCVSGERERLVSCVWVNGKWLLSSDQLVFTLETIFDVLCVGLSSDAPVVDVKWLLCSFFRLSFLPSFETSTLILVFFSVSFSLLWFLTQFLFAVSFLL